MWGYVMPKISEITFATEQAKSLITKIQEWAKHQHTLLNALSTDTRLREALERVIPKLQLEIFTALDQLADLNPEEFIKILSANDLCNADPLNIQWYTNIFFSDYTRSSQQRRNVFLQHADSSAVVIFVQRSIWRLEVIMQHLREPEEVAAHIPSIIDFVNFIKTMLAIKQHITANDADQIRSMMIEYLFSLYAYRFYKLTAEDDARLKEFCGEEILIFSTALQPESYNAHNVQVFKILFKLSQDPLFKERIKKITYDLISTGINIIRLHNGEPATLAFTASMRFCDDDNEQHDLVAHALVCNPEIAAFILHSTLLAAIKSKNKGTIKALHAKLRLDTTWDKFKVLDLVFDFTPGSHSGSYVIQGLLTYLSLNEMSVYDMLTHIAGRVYPNDASGYPKDVYRAIEALLSDLAYYEHEKTQTPGVFYYLAQHPKAVSHIISSTLPHYLHVRYDLNKRSHQGEYYFVVGGHQVAELFMKQNESISPLAVAQQNGNIEFIELVLRTITSSVIVSNELYAAFRQSVLAIADHSRAHRIELELFVAAHKRYRPMRWFSFEYQLWQELQTRREATKLGGMQSKGMFWQACCLHENELEEAAGLMQPLQLGAGTGTEQQTASPSPPI